MDNIFIILLSYIFVLFIIIKFLYNVIGPKLYFPFRLAEIYYRIGLESEAKAAAAMLGYNYNSSEWYEKSYQILNKNYEPIKIKKDDEEESLVRRTLKKIMLIND